MQASARVDELLKNARYALRTMRNSPGVTALAIILLALGIGANTAVFSVLDAILLKSLPVPSPDRLVVLHVERPSAAQTQGATRFSYPMLDDLARASDRVLEGLFTWQLYAVAAGADTEQEATQATFVSGSYFTALQLAPRLGRLLDPSDNSNAEAVAVISDGFWERRFGRNTAVIGQTIQINGYPFTIVGVTPSGFFGVDVGVAPDLWLPIRTMTRASLPGAMLDMREAIWLPGMARLKPGVSAQQAADALVPIFDDIRRIQAGSGATPTRERLELQPGSNGISRLRQQFVTPIVVIMILVALILTIACANLANLQLARAVARTREVAVRVAIGASQSRLVRQLLTESVVLSVFGAIAGLLLARVCVRLLVTTLPAMHDLDVHLDARVLLFCGGVALATAILFGLAPVWMMRRVDVASALKEEMASMGATIRGGWIRQVLVVAQIALTIVLVFGANLFIYTLRNLRSADTGLQTEHVLQLSVNAGRGGATASQRRALFERMLDEVRQVPGVRAAAFTGDELLSGRASRMDIYPPEYQPARNEDVFSVGMSVDAGFFRTLGIPLLQGRDFTPQDTPSAPKVVVLNQAAATFFFKATNPIGRQVGIAGKPDFTVIGVVGNTKFRNLREPMSRIVYLPLPQTPVGAARTLYVSTDSDPTRVAGGVRQAIQATAHDALIHRVKRFSDQIDDSLAQERVTAWLSTFFGLLALTIAALGLYGLMAYTVSRRTREIGVRTALGASPENVVRMVFGQSMIIVLAGAVLGIIVAIALGQLLVSLLYGVTARDPLALFTSATALLITAAVASYLPARRAAAIDPLKALRDER